LSVFFFWPMYCLYERQKYSVDLEDCIHIILYVIPIFAVLWSATSLKIPMEYRTVVSRGQTDQWIVCFLLDQCIICFLFDQCIVWFLFDQCIVCFLLDQCIVCFFVWPMYYLFFVWHIILYVIPIFAVLWSATSLKIPMEYRTVVSRGQTNNTLVKKKNRQYIWPMYYLFFVWPMYCLFFAWPMYCQFFV
jgi:hypothetical protein